MKITTIKSAVLLIFLSLQINLVAQVESLPIEVANLTVPSINRSHSAKLVVNLETQKQLGSIADGVEYVFWSFGDTVPSSFIDL